MEHQRVNCPEPAHLLELHIARVTSLNRPSGIYLSVLKLCIREPKLSLDHFGHSDRSICRRSDPCRQDPDIRHKRVVKCDIGSRNMPDRFSLLAVSRRRGSHLNDPDGFFH